MLSDHNMKCVPESTISWYGMKIACLLFKSTQLVQVEEKELDTSKVNNAMAQIKASQTAAREARR